MTEPVTVIIPTLGKRPQRIHRAIDSIRRQDRVNPTIIVVINGGVYLPGIAEEISAHAGTQVVVTPVTGVSRARYFGRQLVRTPYFAFLDDDDELLPGALAYRIEVMQATGTDVVATNGFCQIDNERCIANRQFGAYPKDPLEALINSNWLDPAGGLYRSATVGAEVFSSLPNHLEWTWLAYLLTRSHSVERINVPTYVRHIGRDDQVTASPDYVYSIPLLLRALDGQLAKSQYRTLTRNKLASAYHYASTYALMRGNYTAAWRMHIKSLHQGNGYRFFSYTRHLLFPPSDDPKDTSLDP